MTKIATRIAPRLSARPVRTLWRASRRAPIRIAMNSVKSTAYAMRSDSGRCCACIRVGTVHGPMRMNDTARPRYAAASMRTRMSGRSGSWPSHAARVSAKSRGAHCGATGENAAIGRSAASNSFGHGGVCVTGCALVELPRHRRESRGAARCMSSVTECMSVSVCGGSSGVTCNASCRGARSRGLVRYQ